MKKFKLLSSATAIALLVGSSTLVWAMDEGGPETPSHPTIPHVSPVSPPEMASANSKLVWALIGGSYHR